jgi:O-antigen/teichoic acid export membrane protein
LFEKLRSLSKQTLIYGTGTVISRFLNFILVPFYTNIFPPSEYGSVSVIFAYIAFLNIFYSLGLESGYFKFASTKELGSEKQNFSIPFFTIFVNGLVLSSVLYLLAEPLTLLVGLSANNSDIIKFSSAIIFFDAISLIPFAYLRLNNRPGFFASLKVINVSVNLALNFLLILVFKVGLVAIFISNFAASVLTFLLLSPIVLKMLTFEFHRGLFTELAKFSIPYLPAGLAAIVVQVVDKPVLQYLSGIESVGIYNANYKLGIFMMLIVSMFEYAWRPFFLTHAGEPEAKRLFANVMNYFLAVSSLILILLTFFVQDIIQIPLPGRGHLIGAKYWLGVYIVPFILYGYLVYGMYVILMAGIYIEKKTRYLPSITGLGALVNLVGNFALIPFLGIMGAAIVTFLSYLAMTLYIYKVAQRFYPVQFDMRIILTFHTVNVFALILFYSTYSAGFITRLIMAAFFIVIILLSFRRMSIVNR